jgi:hypothetical protein
MKYLRVVATLSKIVGMISASDASKKPSRLISMRRKLIISDALNLGAGWHQIPKSSKLSSVTVQKLSSAIKGSLMISIMRMTL